MAATVIKDELGYTFHEVEIATSPALFGSETYVAAADDDWEFFWSLSATDVGKVVYALPDVALIGDGTPQGTLLNNEIVWGSIEILQHYTQTNLSTGDVTSGFVSLATGTEEIDQVLAQQYAGYISAISTYLKVTVPGLRQDKTEFGYQMDYDDQLILKIGANNGALDDIGLSDPNAGRFLVTTNSPGGERASAWGGGWIDLLTNAPPPPPDPEVPSELEDDVAHLNSMASNAFDAAGVLSQANDLTKVASTFFDAAEELRFQAIEAGYVAWPQLIGRSEEFDDYLATIENTDSRLTKVLDLAGKAMTVLDGVSAGFDRYQQTGSLKDAMKAGGTKLFAAFVSGELGTIVGGTTAIWLASAGGAALASTGLPIVAGVAAGYYAGKLAEPYIEATATWAVDWVDSQFDDGNRGEIARVGQQVATWSYNVKTKEFKWLSSAAEKKYAFITTLLDLNPNPVKLKLSGDKLGDKNDMLLGHGANDTVKGLSGDDILFGGRGSDKVLGGVGSDILNGGAANDKLFGDDGDDFLIGSGGNDTMRGGLGQDVMVGGKGRDVFVFDSAAEAGLGDGSDVIADFKQGTDKIDLSKIDANPSKAGNQAFKLDQLSKLTDLSSPRPVTTVFADINGDGAADFSFKLKGIDTVYLSDLIL